MIEGLIALAIIFGVGAYVAKGPGGAPVQARAALKAGAGAGASAGWSTAKARHKARSARRRAVHQRMRARIDGLGRAGRWANAFADTVQGLFRDGAAVTGAVGKAAWKAGSAARREAAESYRLQRIGAAVPGLPEGHPDRMVCISCHSDLVDAMCPRCTRVAQETARDPDTDWDAVRADTAETRRRNDIEIARRRGLYGVPNSPSQPDPPAADETKENPMAAVANIEIMTVDDLEQMLKAIRDAAVTLSETNFTEMAAAARRLPEDVQAAPFDPGDVVNRAISDLAEAAPDPKTFESMFEAADAAMQALKVLDGLREDASDVDGVQGEVAAFRSA